VATKLIYVLGFGSSSFDFGSTAHYTSSAAVVGRVISLSAAAAAQFNSFGSKHRLLCVRAMEEYL
jgi:hypothetical protein